MAFEIINGDSLKVIFGNGDTIKAESDSVVTFTDGVILQGRLDGGFFNAIIRKFFTGESFFFQSLQGITRQGQNPPEAILASPCPGGIAVIQMVPGVNLSMKKGAFIACSDTVSISTSFQNSVTKGLFFLAMGFLTWRPPGVARWLLVAMEIYMSIFWPPAKSELLTMGMSLHGHPRSHLR